MKRKITVVIVTLCLIIALTAPASEAAGNICFTAINNTLEPLDNNTMPAIVGSLLYIPSTVFSLSYDLGVTAVTSEDQVFLYSASKRLLFDTTRDTVIDQDKNLHNIPAVKMNGLIYVPVDMVCGFFGLTYNVLPTKPAPVIHFISSTAVYTETMFIELNKSKMQEYYNTYTGTGTKPGVTPTTPVTPSMAPTYENITEYISVYALTPQSLEGVLKALDAYRYKCCIFVSYDEIASNADLLRRALGAGHSIGIWLKEGTYEEYQKTSGLLFEAAKIKTILVSSGSDTAKAAQAMTAAKGLMFWKATRTYDETDDLSLDTITDRLSTKNGSRESLSFACTEDAVPMLTNLFTYMSLKRYSVQRIVETTAPVASVG
jgi:hypothetical protein